MKKTSFAAMAAGAAIVLASCYTPANPSLGGVAMAQQPLAIESELIVLRQLCWSGSRQACIRFGMMIGANQQRQADWRRAHPDWWEWERW